MWKKTFIGPMLVAVIAVVVAVLNFKSGVWLTGWDTLHPEFDFGLNLARQFSGVWRGDQGLGTVAAHAHMSELPRTLILWALHLIMPIESVRFAFVLMCLILGPLGVYFLVWDGIFKRDEKGITAGLLAGLFFLFNPYTVQHFVMPFEMFQVQYASIGWWFWLGLRAIQQNQKNNYKWLLVVAFFSAPQAYASQLWWVLFLAFGAFLGGVAIFSGEVKRKLGRWVGVMALVLGANVFWLLSNAYFIAKGSQVPKQAVINQLFSPDSFLKNREFGTVQNLVQMKNFLFDWDKYNNQAGFVPVMDDWSGWLDQNEVKAIYYTACGLVILGLLGGLVSKKKEQRAVVGTLLLLGILSGSALLTNTEPFKTGIDWLRSQSGLVEEGLRTPFTKVSIVYLLIYGLGFSIGGTILVDAITAKLGRVKTLAKAIFLTAIAVGLMYGVKPMLAGKLIASEIKLSIPGEYFNLFELMKQKSPNDRVALVPMLSKWGWEYHDWGYQGPGFLWFGLRQPVLTRDFDRWSPYNENFYRQAELAVARQDAALFHQTMQQYKVRWLVMDRSVIEPGMEAETQNMFHQTNELISQNGYINTWEEGRLVVFDTGIQAEAVDAPESWREFKLGGDYWRQDMEYLSNQNSSYIETEGGQGIIPRLDLRNLPNPEALGVEKIGEETWEGNRGFEVAKNCDRLQRGEAKRRLYFQGRAYQASGGASACDYFDYPDLDSNQSYLLHLKSVNEAGRPLKVSVNQFNSFRVVSENLLDPDQNDHWMVVDGLVPGEKGLVVNIETRSFGSIESANRLEAIEFYSLPAGWEKVVNEPDLAKNNLRINSINQWGTGIYKVEADGSGLLALNQGYDEGWIASKKAEHVRVNGWANGWILPEGTTVIYLIYWPQLLEWTGLMGLLYCILVLEKQK